MELKIVIVNLFFFAPHGGQKRDTTPVECNSVSVYIRINTYFVTTTSKIDLFFKASVTHLQCRSKYG